MHPHLKEARDGHASKLRRIAGFHGTEDNPGGNESPGGTAGGGKFMAERPGEVIPNGPQNSVGAKSIHAEGKRPKRNLGKFARGGRTKGKGKGTNVNVIVGHPGAAPAAGGMPMPAPALPMPHPAMAGPPPGAPPGMPPGLPPGLPPGAGMPPGMPPGAPPMMMPHKRGGRTYKNGGSVAPQYPQTVKTASKQDLKSNLRKNGGRTYDAGSVSGEGRLEKIRNYGRKAHMKAKAV